MKGMMQCVTINFSVNNIKTYYIKSPLYGHLCNYNNIYSYINIKYIYRFE